MGRRYDHVNDGSEGERGCSANEWPSLLFVHPVTAFSKIPIQDSAETVITNCQSFDSVILGICTALSTLNTLHLSLADDDVDKTLLVWFKQASSKDAPISGPVLVEKGKKLAKAIGHAYFKMSNRCLDRSKLCLYMVFKEPCIQRDLGFNED